MFSDWAVHQICKRIPNFVGFQIAWTMRSFWRTQNKQKTDEKEGNLVHKINFNYTWSLFFSDGIGAGEIKLLSSEPEPRHELLQHWQYKNEVRTHTANGWPWLLGHSTVTDLATASDCRLVSAEENYYNELIFMQIWFHEYFLKLLRNLKSLYFKIHLGEIRKVFPFPVRNYHNSLCRVLSQLIVRAKCN